MNGYEVLGTIEWFNVLLICDDTGETRSIRVGAIGGHEEAAINALYMARQDDQYNFLNWNVCQRWRVADVSETE
jgi:hypothetical protein